MSRTGLSPADIAKSLRDRCGDGSVEWVYTPTQTWVLLDAADMLDENDQLVMKLNAEHLVRQNVERENAKLRELCATVIDDWMSKVCPTFPFCEYGGEYQDCTDETCGNQIYKQMARELGVEVDG